MADGEIIYKNVRDGDNSEEGSGGGRRVILLPPWFPIHIFPALSNGNTATPSNAVTVMSTSPRIIRDTITTTTSRLQTASPTTSSPHPMSKDVVGHNLWRVMHAFSFAYPETPSTLDQYWARQFYESIGYMFPCAYCRQHYLQMFYHTIPFAAQSRTQLSQWVVAIHNAVNQRLGKPTITYEQVCTWYNDNTKGGNNGKHENGHYLNEDVTSCPIVFENRDTDGTLWMRQVVANTITDAHCWCNQATTLQHAAAAAAIHRTSSNDAIKGTVNTEIIKNPCHINNVDNNNNNSIHAPTDIITTYHSLHSTDPTFATTAPLQPTTNMQSYVNHSIIPNPPSSANPLFHQEQCMVTTVCPQDQQQCMLTMSLSIIRVTFVIIVVIIVIAIVMGIVLLFVRSNPNVAINNKQAIATTTTRALPALYD